jgi:hypothetical protein
LVAALSEGAASGCSWVETITFSSFFCLSVLAAKVVAAAMVKVEASNIWVNFILSILLFFKNYLYWVYIYHHINMDRAHAKEHGIEVQSKQQSETVWLT